MGDERKSYLITYDVASDRRRSHVAKLLCRYGERLQYSVFLLEVRPSKILRIKGELMDLVDFAEGSIVIFPLGQCAVARKTMDFIGVRSYQDMEIPVII